MIKSYSGFDLINYLEFQTQTGFIKPLPLSTKLVSIIQKKVNQNINKGVTSTT